ncbi:LLM class flavin-dependent oxidoreductase [Paenibacillaceae bacterium WGS1546]|uniref:LLM class flavin-dependent oxidoreductase n=1 Tax=Cohnella sp. WGS1546 TaxID=3366810 RepID=UPI00372D263D
MAKKIILNAFDMNTTSQTGHGLWKHPEDQRYRYKDIDYWVEVARLLEQGKFDGLFFADSFGVPDVYKGNSDAGIRDGVLFPTNDPFMLVSAMAHATRHLSFAITASTTFEHPYAYARRVSTLDHLTKGRFGWNIVTSFIPGQAKNHGFTDIIPHDERYNIADEFLSVQYKLQEGSWTDGYAVRDKEKGVIFDPRKIHPINHDEKYFQVKGPHVSEPSPQRMPLLFQAGNSPRGKAFAAKHAEVVLTVGSTAEEVRAFIRDVRELAARQGRDPANIKFLSVILIIVGKTELEAKERRDEYARLWSREGALAYHCSLTGYDLGKYDRDSYLEYAGTERHQTAAGAIKKASEKRQTVGELIDRVSSFEEQKAFIGSPGQVADQMQAWVEETGIDGYNILQFVAPADLRNIVELVIPELQRRGIFKTEYEEGTFREKLFGPGRSRLPDDHPAARYRRS